MWALIEKLLGLGVIPPEWKQRIYSLLLAVVALVEQFVDIPDEWHSEAVLLKIAAAIAVVIAFIMKKVRDAKA